jgi:LmbE family N-acetylglucosaminyl deacetylase
MLMSQLLMESRRGAKTKLHGPVSLLVLVALIGISATAQVPDKTPELSQNKVDHFYEPLPQETGETGLKLMLRRLQTTARLMQTTAHPDDEDGGMLTLESRGNGVSTLLMTLNRGEGGQNKIGSNLFDVLGVLRTLELLASDRYYGVEQRFSRVADFGYSKNAEETFQKWQGHEIPLADMVRVIRTFRPDVLVARFSGTDRDGHGHHQASEILTREAFRAAADPKRFADQIAEGLAPWQAKKLYIGNVCGFGAMTCDAANYTLRLNTGVVDPLLGTSYIQFAMQGLRHQQSQGAANWTVEPGDRFTFYKLVDTVVESPKDKEGHEQNFFDGIDTSWPGLAARLGDEEKKVPWLRGDLSSIASEIKHAVDKSESDPAASAEPLSRAAEKLDSIIERLKAAHMDAASSGNVLVVLRAKQQEAQKALNIALGVHLDVTASSGTVHPRETAPPFQDALTVVSPGQTFQVMAQLRNHSDRWLLVDSAEIDGAEGWIRQADAGQMTIKPGETYYANFALKVPADAPPSRPYWHRDNPERDAINNVDDERYRTLPFPPAPLRVRIRYEVVEHSRRQSPLPDMIKNRLAKKEIPVEEISSPVFVPFVDESGNRDKFPLAVAPTFSVSLEPGEHVLPIQNEKQITVKVGISCNRTGAPDGKLRLELPSDWRSEPEELPVALAKRGDKQDFLFKVLPGSLREGRTEVRAVFEAGGQKYAEGYTLVPREDLGAAYYYQPAAQHVSVVNVKVPKELKVGYVMGAGDEIPTVLAQLGMDVTLIAADKLGRQDLSAYQTIVLGIRAYDTQKDVAANNKRLLDFVQAGGRLVVQYNTSPADFNKGNFTPYPATLSRARVSVEEAPVKLLDPSNPIFHSPNEITQQDFEGWVQERGLYFMSQWDTHFTPLLESHDPGESEQKGGLLIAQYGKGTYIYTGYAFFRQLPAGVPGAVRLFVNLIASR